MPSVTTLAIMMALLQLLILHGGLIRIGRSFPDENQNDTSCDDPSEF